MDWVGMSFSFVGLYILPTRLKTAVILWIIGNLLWLGYAVPNGAWSVVVLQLVLLVLNIRTLWMKGRKNVL